MPSERSTKRQKELLEYVDRFIAEHGYGPSYREIMNAIGYKSVSTVAIHIDGLIAKGYLRKRDNSARSLEVVTTTMTAAGPAARKVDPAKEKWLVEEIKRRFGMYNETPSPQLMDELYVLVGALKVLGFDGAYESTRAELAQLMRR
ncbi:TPA: hypothetical protein DD425_02370 [Candidatus Saccharibacteria bacterium]|nr:hypothetical protein [Candidatus Saccharibacteria bacterium]|tara:strand:- start:341 stop:778 length:438 start_codon:yes stop_codon:yes gene_type:complete